MNLDILSRIVTGFMEDELQYDKDLWRAELEKILKWTENIPKHVAIIMDGNRRWAKTRGYHPLAGHKAGVRALKDVVAGAKDIGVKALSVYAFSKENWRRSDEEVQGLFQLFKYFIAKEVPKLKEEGIKLRFVGDLTEMPEDLREAFKWGEEETSEGQAMDFNVLVNYSGKWDIIQAVRRMISEGIKPEEIDESLFLSYLALPDEPDLIIRTSGELRLSNFLIWQSAYSELYFTEKLWPDFTRFDLLKAVESYMRRQRRFGK